MYGFKWFWNCKYATSQMLLLLHYITKTFAKTIFISRIDYTNRLQNLLKKVQWFNSWQINSPLQISYELEVGYKIKPRDCMASWSHSLLAPDDIQHDWTFLTCCSYCVTVIHLRVAYIGSQPAQTIDSCVNLCESRQEPCTHFVFDPQNQRCYFKKATGPLHVEDYSRDAIQIDCGLLTHRFTDDYNNIEFIPKSNINCEKQTTTTTTTTAAAAT